MMNERMSQRDVLSEGEDVVAYLLHSHRVTRSLLDVAQRVIEEHGLERQIVSVADAMQRFFTFWNPLHEIDEEQTVAPAVSAFAPHAMAAAVVAQLVREHQELDTVRDLVSRPWGELRGSARDFGALREELRASTRLLAAALARHTASEERAFFPLVRRYVPAADQRAMLIVMRLRRRGAIATAR